MEALLSFPTFLYTLPGRALPSLQLSSSSSLSSSFPSSSSSGERKAAALEGEVVTGSGDGRAFLSSRWDLSAPSSPAGPWMSRFEELDTTNMLLKQIVFLGSQGSRCSRNQFASPELRDQDVVGTNCYSRAQVNEVSFTERPFNKIWLLIIGFFGNSSDVFGVRGRLIAVVD